MERLIEIRTLISALLISFFGWLLGKVYAYFDIKLKRIDSIEELKKEVYDFKQEYKEDNKEIKGKIDMIFEKLMD
jgi:hypothetical protein